MDVDKLGATLQLVLWRQRASPERVPVLVQIDPDASADEIFRLTGTRVRRRRPVIHCCLRPEEISRLSDAPWCIDIMFAEQYTAHPILVAAEHAACIAAQPVPPAVVDLRDDPSSESDAAEPAPPRRIAT